MTILELPVQSGNPDIGFSSNFAYTILLEDVQFGLTFKTNKPDDSWFMDISTVNFEPVVLGLGLAVGSDLLFPYRSLGDLIPPGILYCSAPLGMPAKYLSTSSKYTTSPSNSTSNAPFAWNAKSFIDASTLRFAVLANGIRSMPRTSSAARAGGTPSLNSKACARSRTRSLSLPESLIGTTRLRRDRSLVTSTRRL